MKKEMVTIKIPLELKNRLDTMKPRTQSYAVFLTELLTPIGQEYKKISRLADYRLHELAIGEMVEIPANDINDVALVNNHLKYMKSKYKLDLRIDRQIRFGVLYISVTRI